MKKGGDFGKYGDLCGKNEAATISVQKHDVSTLFAKLTSSLIFNKHRNGVDVVIYLSAKNAQFSECQTFPST